MSTPRPLPLVGLLAALLLLLAPSAAADVVHLRTGEAVKGRPIQERSNDNILIVEDYLTGSLRAFAWEAVDPADRVALQEAWGLVNTGQKLVTGDRVEYRLESGRATEIRGLVESENDTTIFIRRDGRIIEVPKARVVGRDREDMDVREIWGPDQLYDRQKAAMLAQLQGDASKWTALQDQQLATYAEWAGALEKAREHYQKAAADEGFLQKDTAAQRLARVEALLQDKAALDTLKDARLKLGMNVFRRVREILDGFGEKHPDASDAVKQKLEDLRAEFTERRTREFQKLARQKFVDIVETLIRDKVREKDVTITDLTSWTRRELPDAAFKILAERTMKSNDDVTPEEARQFWEGRPKTQYRRISYGAGTFIVEPAKMKAPTQRRTTGGGGGGNRPGSGGGGTTPQFQIPKPPTRDQWWEEIATTRDRLEWVLAYFIEHSELFEMDDREFRLCVMCNGVGLLSKLLQTGDTLSYLCTRCGGAQKDVIVVFR